MSQIESQAAVLNSESDKELRDLVHAEFKHLKDEEEKANTLERDAQMLLEQAAEIRSRVKTARMKILDVLGGGKNFPQSFRKELKPRVLEAVEKLSLSKEEFIFDDIIRYIKNTAPSLNVRTKTARRSVARILSRMTRSGKLQSLRRGRATAYSSKTRQKVQTKKEGKTKSPAFSLEVLQAMENLGRDGSKVTAKAVQHKLVDSHQSDYTRVPLRKVENAITHLRIRRGLISAQKHGSETRYVITEKGHEVLKNKAGAS